MPVLYIKLLLPGKTLKHNDRYYTRLDKLSNSASKQMHVTEHYHMGINYDEWKGHVFTAESAFDNKLLIYDAQIGDFLNISALGDVKTIGILKVDKMMFNINVLDNISMSI